MKNFVYHSPAKVIFGKDQINTLKTELMDGNIKSVLLVYGKSSIQKLGIYDAVCEMIRDLEIELYEVSGVRPNPEITSVYQGIDLCKTNNIDFVLAVGGGSVIDAAKAIALGALLEEDVWDVYKLKVIPSESLPLGVVITLAATGSETNGNSVISNDATNEKRAFGSPLSIPRFAIIDPTYTLSVNRHHTIAGSIDIIMHVLEQYFSKTPNTTTSDYMMMGLINSVIEQTNYLINGYDSYDVRANISWASTIALNWILGVDKQGDWATHRLSYVLTNEYGVTHGYALAMLFTSWIRVARRYEQDVIDQKLIRLGQLVFQINDPLETIVALERVFQTWGAVTSIKDANLNITENDVDRLVNTALELGYVGTVVTVTHNIAKEIFQDSRKRVSYMTNNEIEHIYSQLFEGVYVVNQNRKIIFWNKGAELITGYTKSEVENHYCYHNILRHVTEDGKEICYGGCPLHNTLKSGQINENTVYLHHKEGHRIPVNVRTMPITDEDGNIIAAVEVFTDTSYMRDAVNENRKLKEQLNLDYLTQVYNRQYMDFIFHTMLEESNLFGTKYGLLFIDIDLFKNVNGSYGHVIGDQVLALVAKTIQRNIRSEDVLGRYGGEEFVVVLKNIDKKEMYTIAEKLRILVSKSSFTDENDRVISVTISIGGTIFDSAETIDELIKRSDKLMYEAKSSGRNKVIIK